MDENLRVPTLIGLRRITDSASTLTTAGLPAEAETRHHAAAPVNSSDHVTGGEDP